MQLVYRVAKDFHLDKEDILAKRTSHTEIRNAAIRKVRKESNLTLKEIGELFGGLSHSAISKILNSDNDASV